MTLLRLEGVEKSYRLGKSVRVPALRGLDLEIGPGEFVAIVGPSGSGKTTLLNLAGLLDRPDSGEITLAGRKTASLPEAERARLRRDTIGFIFQTFNLLPHLTAEENVALPLRYGTQNGARLTPAELLERVGLGQRLAHKPDELSGGEQQRVAIARAMMLDPPLILADEPTGDLDSETAAGIVEVLHELREQGKTLIVVTHNEDLAHAAGRLVHVRDGHIVDDSSVPKPPPPVVERRPRKTSPRKKPAEAKKKATVRKATSRKSPVKATAAKKRAH